MDCLFVPKKKIYRVINQTNKESYLFLGHYSYTKAILNKYNNNEKISSEEQKILIDAYGKNIMDEIKVSTKVFPLFINAYDDIYTIKKKLIYTCCTESNVNDLYIFAKRKSLSIQERTNYIVRQKMDFNKFYETLGYKYINDIGTLYLNPDFKENTTSLEYDDTFVDENGKLLGTYGSIGNTIYYYDLNETLEISDENRAIYFPYLKRQNENINYDNIKKSLKDKIAIENYYEEKSNELNVKNDKCVLNNIMFKQTIINGGTLDLAFIFDNFELNELVLFSKLNSETYKIYNKNDIVKRTQPLKKNDYFIDYEKNYYTPNISKETLISWINRKYSDKEKQYIKTQSFYDKSYYDIYNNNITYKVKFYDSYIDVIINVDGECFVKNSNMYLDQKKQDELYELINGLLKQVAKLVKKPLLFIKKGLINYIQCDMTYDINTDATKIKKLKSAINYFQNHFLLKPSTTTKEINCVYFRVDQYNNSINHKQIFQNLKENYPNYSVTQFEELWLKTTSNLFGFSNNESLYVLRRILDEYSNKELTSISVDYNIEINIKSNYTGNSNSIENFTISIKNSNTLTEIANIREHIMVLFSKANELKSNIVNEEVSIEKKELQVSKSTFEAQDDLDFDLDLDLDLDMDLDPSENTVEEQDINLDTLEYEEKAKEPELELEDDEIKYQKNTMRNYMSKIRNKDPKLLKYKSQENFSSFSIKCGAVDMRQPIIMTNTEMKNFEKTNPESFKEINKLEWGSSTNTKNFYMCPRIYCIRDKIALTDNQLINNNGKCPFCQGEIIDSQTKEMTENQTVIVRRAGSNKYWANPRIKKSELWKKYLAETEKDAYPGFLDPKLHPNGLCMPCCNSNQNWNFSKCLIHEVDYLNITNDLVNIPDKYKPNDVILYKKKGIYRVNNERKLEKETEFTKLKVPLTTGMVFKVKNSNENILYEAFYNTDNKLSFRIKPDKSFKGNEIYLLGKDKYPLYEDKVGALPTIIDDLFSNSTSEKIYNSRIKETSSILVRYGIKQEYNLSFLNSISAVLEKTTDGLIKTIIKNITPELFISLNNGDIFKMFSSNSEDLSENNIDHLSLYTKFTEKYNDFAKQNSKNDRFLYQVFYSFERFKNYLGDMNVSKEPLFFVDLLSRKLSWLVPNGLNVIIIERYIILNKEKLYINIPQIDNLDLLFQKSNATCLIYKYRGLYEPIVEIIANELKPIIESPIMMSSLTKIVNLLKQEGSRGVQHNTKIDLHELPNIAPLKKQYKETVKAFIIDSYNKGIGILLNNNLAIFTVPFDTYRFKNSNIDTIDYENLPLMDIDNLKKKLTNENIEFHKYVLNNGEINGIVVRGNMVHPCKPVDFEVDNFEIFDRISSETQTKNFNNTLVNFYNKEQLFIEFKREFSAFFNTKTSNVNNLKNKINSLLDNPIMDYTYKLNNIYLLLVQLGNMLIKGYKTNPYNKSLSNKTCFTMKHSKCKKSNKCEYVYDKEAYTKTITFINENYLVNTSKCSLKMNEKDLKEFIKILSAKIVSNYNVRMEIIENVYKKKIQSTSVLFNRENIIDSINKLYNGYNFYVQNDIVSFPKLINVNKELIKTINKIIETETKEIYGTTMTKTNIDMSRSTNVKAGKCIFPFKVETENYVETFYDCKSHPNPLNGNICATEVNEDNIMTKYGFCGTEPAEEPEEEPTQEPSQEPAQEPTQEPDQEPAQEPTQEPDQEPAQESINNNKCIIPFNYEETLYSSCVEKENGKSFCPVVKRNDNKYKDSHLEECKVDNMKVPDNLLEEFQKPSNNMMFFGTKDNYIKRPFIYSLKRAMELAKEIPECTGIMYHKEDNRFSLRKSSKLKRDDNFMVWLKKDITPKIIVKKTKKIIKINRNNKTKSNRNNKTKLNRNNKNKSNRNNKTKSKQMTINDNECIIPFTFKDDKKYESCLDEKNNGIEICPTQVSKTGKYKKYEQCTIELPSQEQLDKYTTGYKDYCFYGKTNNAIKGPYIYTLKKAIEKANEIPECTGIMYHEKDKRYSLRQSSTLENKPGFTCYLKKNVEIKFK